MQSNKKQLLKPTLLGILAIAICAGIFALAGYLVNAQEYDTPEEVSTPKAISATPQPEETFAKNYSVAIAPGSDSPTEHELPAEQAAAAGVKAMIKLFDLDPSGEEIIMKFQGSWKSEIISNYPLWHGEVYLSKDKFVFFSIHAVTGELFYITWQDIDPVTKDSIGYPKTDGKKVEPSEYFQQVRDIIVENQLFVNDIADIHAAEITTSENEIDPSLADIELDHSYDNIECTIVARSTKGEQASFWFSNADKKLRYVLVDFFITS